MTDYLYTSGGFPASPSSGDSLVINGLFYDWTGTAWKVRSIVTNRVEFIATANQATKTGLTYFVGSIDCYINGAKMLLGTDFTATNGTSVTFTPALDLDDEVQLIMGVSASISGAPTFQSTNTLADGASVTHALGFDHGNKSVVHLRELIAGTTSVNSNWDFDTGDSALWSGNGTFSGGVLTLNEVTAGITVTQIATNGAHSLAVLSNGTVKGTGTNSHGQLGLGNNTNQTSWALTGLSNITAVAIGDVHSLALNSSGSLFLTGRRWFRPYRF